MYAASRPTPADQPGRPRYTGEGPKSPLRRETIEARSGAAALKPGRFPVVGRSGASLRGHRFLRRLLEPPANCDREDDPDDDQADVHERKLPRGEAEPRGAREHHTRGQHVAEADEERVVRLLRLVFGFAAGGQVERMARRVLQRIVEG